MGTAKALLPFGPELMLQRVVRIVRNVVSPENIIVVAAMGQQLPTLPAKVNLTFDRRENCGPLEGLAVGLRGLKARVDAAYVTSCDVPLLVSAFIERMFELLGEQDIAVPREEKFHHPLAAVYRTSVLPTVERLLADERYRPVFLFEQHTTRKIPVDVLRDVDPELASLANCNRPEDYQQAIRLAGFEDNES